VSRKCAIGRELCTQTSRVITGHLTQGSDRIVRSLLTALGTDQAAIHCEVVGDTAGCMLWARRSSSVYYAHGW
jgi:hypothetical protein